MKPHPRIRKTIKWTGAAVTMLLVVVWITTSWEYVGRRGPTFGAAAIDGRFFLRFQHQRTAPEWWHKSATDAIHAKRVWLFESAFDGISDSVDVIPRPSYEYECPIWMIASVVAVPTTLAWLFDIRSRFRDRVGRCTKCNYDRTGLPIGAACPECGHGSAA